jgi:hypothetical protein
MGSLSFLVKNFILVDIELVYKFLVPMVSIMYVLILIFIHLIFRSLTFFKKKSYGKNRKIEKKVGLPHFNNKKANFNVNELSCQEMSLR